MAKDNGGAAFPSDTENYGPQCGMSLRDYFAAKVMNGIVSGIMANGATLDDTYVNKAVHAAYFAADQMLSERAK